MSDPIEAIINDDAVGFRDRIHDMLVQKVADRLEVERPLVAANMFGGNQETQGEE